MDNRRLLLLLVFSFSLVMLWDAWQKYNQPKASHGGRRRMAQAPTPQPSAACMRRFPAPRRRLPLRPRARKAETVTVKTDLFVAEVSPGRRHRPSRVQPLQGQRQDKTRTCPLRGEAPVRRAERSDRRGLPNHKTVFTALPGRELAGDARTVELRLEARRYQRRQGRQRSTPSARGSYLINVRTRSTTAVTRRCWRTPTISCSATSRRLTARVRWSRPSPVRRCIPTRRSSRRSTLPTSRRARPSSRARPTTAGSPWFSTTSSPPGSRSPGCRVSSTCASSKKRHPAVAAGVIVPGPWCCAGREGFVFGSDLCRPADPDDARTARQAKADGGIGAQGLPLVVDYGWLTVIAAPIFWCLEAIYKVVGNWGWAIVLLTVASSCCSSRCRRPATSRWPR
jgi:YidC/Oxa1 family membrane protein insertase